MNKILISNLKMYLNFEQEMSLFKEILGQKELFNNFIFCPSFVSLKSVHNLNSNIKIGAQDCAPQENGALTGEVSAKSLQEVGCTYCIVGHSERRRVFGEGIEIINHKIELLLKNKISPIICIGEGLQQKNKEKLKEEILNQLNQIKNIKDCIIAYEPIWAIGKKINPQKEYVKFVINLIKNNSNAKVVYGGNVNSENIKELSQIKNLNGFLIGRASTDFQELKKMIKLIN